jgi:hypothetical protein
MKLSILMALNAVVAGVFGIAFVLLPGQALSWYGVTGDAQLTYVARLFGAALITFALITWMARDAADSDARRAIVMGLAAGDIVGFVIALMAQLGGVVNSLGWSTVAIYLLLGLGFGSFALGKATTPSA